MTTTFGPTAGTPGTDPGASLGQDDYYDYLGPMLRGDGVNASAPGGSTLQVYGNSSGLQVLVRPGSALIRGAMFRNSADITLSIASNSSGSTRIDRVVLSLNRSAKTIAPIVITGTPGAGPPAYTRTVGGTWQLPLAQVTVASGAAGINPGDVADERGYLPMSVALVDSRFALPPTDGSQGWVCYDLNPGVRDLLVLGYSGWVTSRAQFESGWQNLAYDGAVTPIAGNPPPQYRQWGAHVDVACYVSIVTPATGFLICTLPVGSRPSPFNPTRRVWPARFLGSTANGGQPGWVTLSPNGVIAVNANDLVTGWLPGATVEFNFSFLAG